MRFLLFFFLCSFITSFSQRQARIDFIRVDVEVLPILESGEIYGKGIYDFELESRVDSVFLDAVGMTFLHVSLNGKKIRYSNSDNKLAFKAPQKKGLHELFLRFVSVPKQTVYFVNSASSEGQSVVTEETRSDLNEKEASSGLSHRSNFNHQIWTQGQGKYTSHWLPSVDDMNDKIEFDLTILMDEEYQVIANGKLEGTNTTEGLTEWNFDMTQPISSYLAAFVIGDFDKKVLESASGVPIELYYEPKDSLKVEPTYRYTKEIFDFLEEEIGVAYPWQNYKQVPVQDFLYAGMENTGCTIFSNQYVIDATAFVDKNYVNINAHELAHQWFGNLVTEVSGEHHWLHEGFATYYAYLTEKELLGDDYFYWKLYDSAKLLNNASENGGGESLLDSGSGSLTFYEKGAWALVMLREQLGDGSFRKGIQSYLKDFAFRNATVLDFLGHMEVASGTDLANFQRTWLESNEFPWEESKSFLKTRSGSLKTYFEIEKPEDSSKVLDEERFSSIWNRSAATQYKRQLLFDLGAQIPNSSIQEIIRNEALEVRQALAIAVPKISKELKADFESMLDDKSYLTQETLLFKFWEAFPINRNKYLDKLDGVVGLPNKNVRLLWLTLALVTPEYKPDSKKLFYDELNSYTASHYNFEVRQSAFQYLFQIEAFSENSLKNLIQALDHHVWQFKKSSRNLVRQLYSTESGKTRLDGILNQLSEAHKSLLLNVINP